MRELLFSAVTDRGDARPRNEDSIFAKAAERRGHQIGLFAVADGCGGLDSGEEISSLITLRAAALFEKLISAEETAENEAWHDALDRLIDLELRGLNRELLNYFRNKGQRAGSTLSLLFIIDDKYIVKNIGDSRVYLSRKRLLELLTEDQSLTRGSADRSTAERPAYSNVLTMCLGVFDEIEISTYRGQFRVDDRFLICSDGLYKVLEEKHMSELLAQSRDNIIGAADILRRGIPTGTASDNVSVIVCGYKRENLLKELKARLRRE